MSLSSHYVNYFDANLPPSAPPGTPASVGASEGTPSGPEDPTATYDASADLLDEEHHRFHDRLSFLNSLMK